MWLLVNYNFMVQYPCFTHNPQPGGPGYHSFVWLTILGLSGNGGPTRSLSSHRFSPQSHLGKQASSPRQGDDAVKDELV